MPETPDRRQEVRVTVPPRLSDPGPEARQTRLFDLSPNGARIVHLHPIEDWSMCYLDLPRALGGVRLQGQVVWSHIAGYQPVVEGKSWLVYQSGLVFRWLTSEQRARLTAALETLKAAHEE